MTSLELEATHGAIIAFIKKQMPLDFWADAWVLREQYHKRLAQFSSAYHNFSFITPRWRKHPARAEMEYRLPLTRGYVLALLLKELGHREEWMYLHALIERVRKYEGEEELFARSAQFLLPNEYPQSGSDTDKMIKIASYFGIGYAAEYGDFFWLPHQ